MIQVGDGIEALRLFKEHRHILSLVLTDLQIPGLHGLDLIRAIRRTDTNIPIAVLSGTIEQWAPEQFNGLGIAAFVKKPFTASQLWKTISDLRSRPSAPVPSAQKAELEGA